MKTSKLGCAARLRFSLSLVIIIVAVFFLLQTGVGVAGASAASTPVADTASIPRDAGSPVLVELFTSEGCSSCPPADALLGKLDGMQPIPGADVIVLSEHVDYWNHDGWKDAYSSTFFTDRQEDYVHRFGLNSPYTPQMVVDGAAQLNGSDALAVGRAVETARGHVKIPVRISGASVVNGKAIRVHLAVDALPEDAKTRKADIFVAIALNHAESHVSAGENKGRDIRHVAVVESINKVGTVEKGKNFDRDVVVKVKSAPDPANLRLVAFVQESDAGMVVGASRANLAGH